MTASVQPAFLPSETTWLEKRVGPVRMQRTYPFRSLLDAGTRLAGGSDCPVEPPHPLWGMAASRDRSGLVPEEGLTPDEALRLFTLDAAAAIGEDGSLRSRRSRIVHNPRRRSGDRNSGRTPHDESARSVGGRG